MYLLFIAVVLSVLKLLEWGPGVHLSWGLVLTLYAATAIWWVVADVTGYTARRQQMKEEKKRQRKARQRAKELGLIR